MDTKRLDPQTIIGAATSILGIVALLIFLVALS